MLWNAFRGKPIGSLRPRSSGIKAEEKNGALRAFWMGPVPAARLALRASRLIEWDRDAFGASRLTTVAAAVPFGIAAVLL